jgi:hypothetical protein
MRGSLLLPFLLAAPESRALSTGGAVALIAPPASAALGALESTAQIRLFAEAQAVVLGSDLAVDVALPGFYDQPSDLTPGTIPAGTQVWSWLLHFDTDGGTSNHLSGSVTFDKGIVGLIFLDASLDASDAAMGLAISYAAGDPTRGTELGPSASGDKLAIEPGTRTLTLTRLNVALGMDEVRVLVAASEPGGLVAAALALLAARLWERRR